MPLLRTLRPSLAKCIYGKSNQLVSTGEWLVTMVKHELKYVCRNLFTSDRVLRNTLLVTSHLRYTHVSNVITPSSVPTLTTVKTWRVRLLILLRPSARIQTTTFCQLWNPQLLEFLLEHRYAMLSISLKVDEPRMPWDGRGDTTHAFIVRQKSISSSLYIVIQMNSSVGRQCRCVRSVYSERRK